MRVPAWMIFALLVSILIMDFTTAFVIRNKIITASEQALDAAIVGAISERTALGELVVNESEGYSLARSYFKKNLNLNSNLENQYMKNTTFELTFVQDKENPEASVLVKTVITAVSPKVLGLEGMPITISKKMYQKNNFN